MTGSPSDHDAEKAVMRCLSGGAKRHGVDRESLAAIVMFRTGGMTVAGTAVATGEGMVHLEIKAVCEAV